MREGAWINAHTGAWSWISEHASWIQNPGNARSLGMTDDVHALLAAIPWDFNGQGREAILRTAMAAGFIRVRGHGASVTFEFTIPTESAIETAMPFMAQNFGPLTGCIFNNLMTGQRFGLAYEALPAALERRAFAPPDCAESPSDGKGGLFSASDQQDRECPSTSAILSSESQVSPPEVLARDSEPQG